MAGERKEHKGMQGFKGRGKRPVSLPRGRAQHSLQMASDVNGHPEIHSQLH